MLKRLSIRLKLLIGMSLLTAVSIMTIGVLGYWASVEMSRKLLSGYPPSAISPFNPLMAAVVPFLILVAIAVSFLMAHALCRPIISLQRFSEQIAAGNYSGHAEISSHDEIGDLARAFNRMIAQIEKDFGEMKEQKAQIEEYSRDLELHKNNLEELVQERTRELTETMENLQHTQAQLAEKEKMAALGQLIAGVAHEINTPLGAIKASFNNISDSLRQALKTLPELLQGMPPEQQRHFFDLVELSSGRESNLSSKEERAAKRALRKELEEKSIANADTMADLLTDMSIGGESRDYLPILEASANPFELMECAYQLSGLARNTRTIGVAVERAAIMVFALKSFAHFDQSGLPSESNIMNGIETVLTLYRNQIKRATELIKNYEEIPLIMCYPDELNQVWTNLIHNALQAMEYKGTLEVDVKKEGDYIAVSITDSGCGIPEEIREKIFNPFFTTKRQGEGTGLGLDIVKRIVDKHHGELNYTSRPGRTTFTVKIPMHLQEMLDAAS